MEVKARADLEEAAWSVTERQRARIVAAAGLGSPGTPMSAFAISGSMRSWSRRAISPAISPRRSKPVDHGRLVKSRQAACSLAKN